MVALATHHADIDNDDMNALDVLEHPIPGRKGVSTLGAGVNVEQSLAVFKTVMMGSAVATNPFPAPDNLPCHLSLSPSHFISYSYYNRLTSHTKLTTPAQV